SVVFHAGKSDPQIIIVDNGAKVNQNALFQSVSPDVVYVQSEKNLGFAGGNNLGIQYATGDYLLFLNNDTEITAGFIETLRDELDCHPDIGILSPLILYYENKSKIQYAGFTPMNYWTGRNKGIGSMENDG